MSSSLLNSLEDSADELLRAIRPIVPPLARACIMGTFIEDGLRLLGQFSGHVAYMNEQWHCGTILASLIVLFFIVGQVTLPFPLPLLLALLYLSLSFTPIQLRF